MSVPSTSNVSSSTNTILKLRYKKLIPSAISPSKSRQDQAGFILCSSEATLISPLSVGLVKTGIAIQLPHGHYGRIAPLHDLSEANFIDVGAGVIDEDYRGQICIIIFNHAQEPYNVETGAPIAQLICQEIEYSTLEEINETDTNLSTGQTV